MNDLSLAIRGIRQRLAKTMAEFAEMIGCRQSTVSRYESGKLTPGRSVLILLLQLAQGRERQPILEALQVDRSLASGWNESDLVDALKTFEDYLESSPAPAGSREARKYASTLTAFAKAAKRIVLKGSDVEPALIDILHHWINHAENRNAHGYFRHVAAYLEVQLTVLEARKGKPLPKPAP
jgi:transcriptional regulator with XRE-family HTH domain